MDIDLGVRLIVQVLLMRAIQQRTSSPKANKRDLSETTGMAHWETTTKYLELAIDTFHIGVSPVEDSERCEMRYDLSWVLHELGLGHLRESPRNEYLEAGEQPTTYVSRYAKIGQTGAEHFNTAWELKGRLPIYVYLSQNGATKGAVMQRALGMIRSSFYQRLGWLQEEGIVERVDGKYRLIGVNIVKVLRIKERIEEIKRSYQRRWEKYCAWMEEKIDDLDRYKAVRTLRSFINARKTTAFA